MKPTRLLSYLITPPPSEAYLLTLPQILKSYPVDWIMYRDTSPMPSSELIAMFLELVRPFGKKLIVNLPFENSPHTAHKIMAFVEEKGFDGVHLKSYLLRHLSKLCSLRARNTGLDSETLCPIIGYSAHSVGEVEAAIRLGASYATLSPIFPTPNKGTPLGIEALTQLPPHLRAQTFALGGITCERIEALKPLGILGFAAIGYFKL